MAKRPDDISCLLNINKKIVKEIDYFRKKNHDSRTSWIVKAILYKLKSLGCNIEKLLLDEEE